MFLIIVMFLILSSFACPIALLSGHKFEEGLPLGIFAIIIILYVSGLCGSLTYGFYAVLVIAALCAGLTAVLLIRGKKRSAALLFTPGLLAFCVFYLLFCWYTRGMLLTVLDEFSHWGLTVKYMYLLNALPSNPKDLDHFRDYPPATALFQYFWVKVSGSFSERNIPRSLDVLSLSLLLPVFKNLSWSKWKRIPFILAILYLIPYFLCTDIYTSILVDIVLGLLFSYLLTSYFTSRPDLFLLFSLCGASFVLTITKASGYGLALIAVLIMAVDVLRFRRKELIGKYAGSGKRLACRLAVLLSPVFCIFAAHYSWAVNLKLEKVEIGRDLSVITLPGILGLFTGRIQAYQKETAGNFLLAFFNQYTEGGLAELSTVGWLLILAAVGFLLFRHLDSGTDKKRFRYCAAALSVSFVVYCFSLLLLYLFTYSDYEAVRVASFPRYMSTILTGILSTFLCVMIVHSNRRQAEGGREFRFAVIPSLAVLLAVTPLKPAVSHTLHAPLYSAVTISQRRPYDEIARKLKTIETDRNALELISIANKGNDYQAMKYVLLPMRVDGPYSIGKPYYDGDIWTEDITPESWGRLLSRKFNYVYLYKINEPFRDAYSSVFIGGKSSILPNRLYRVVKKGETALLALCGNP